eukprot:TRINITY_DN7299_c0_g1_i1.p1 TRINITY_DN7299_c0_g1~~TRINITY_DN7299_c0_g1_i1.p1  ORF type:complete len:338 (+),score=64.98 TRINITY_DN7299_c0_g1_i1:32-1015(+)
MDVEQTDTLPWVEKYRPNNLDELISQDHIVGTLKNLINSNNLPHVLLYGPPGTGKTSTILAMAKMMHGDNYQNLVLELNASDERKISVVREQIKLFASTRMMFEDAGAIKIIILDEADAMLKDSQAALRRVMERWTKNCRFCIICNHVNKISHAIQSRCTKFRFSPLSDDQIIGRLKYIIEQEGVEATEGGIKALINLAEGDMRKIINVLQSTNMSFGVVNEVNVYKTTGNPNPEDIHSMLQVMLQKDYNEAFQYVYDLKEEKGLALSDIITDIHRRVMHIQFDKSHLADIYPKLSEIEHRLSRGSNEKIQLGALVAVFQLIRGKVE